jgi:Tfp pilus assembly protein PilF
MKKRILVFCIVLTGYTGYSQKVSDNEILKIAYNIEESITNNYLKYINDLFDFQLFNELYLAINDDILVQSFNKGFVEEIKLNLDPGLWIKDEMGENGTYTFIGLKTKNNDTILVFQLLNDDGLNYHDFYVTRISGEISITDIYNYSRYELLSESIGNIYYRSLYSIFPEMDKLGKLNDYNTIDKHEQKLASLLLRGKFSQAYKKYNNLPEKYKNNKQLLLMAIKAASFTGNVETESVLQRYLNNFSTDNRIYLLPVDGLFSTGKYELSLKYLDKLDQEVGGDPFLNFYRAKIQDEAGNISLAEIYYTQLNKSMPELQTGFFSLLELYILNEDYIAAIGVLDEIESSFGYYKKDLKFILQDYTNFYNSNEFVQWTEN